MALGNGTTPNGGVTQEKAPVVNGTNMETLPRAEKKVNMNKWWWAFFYVAERVPSGLHILNDDTINRIRVICCSLNWC